MIVEAVLGLGLMGSGDCHRTTPAEEKGVGARLGEGAHVPIMVGWSFACQGLVLFNTMCHVTYVVPSIIRFISNSKSTAWLALCELSASVLVVPVVPVVEINTLCLPALSKGIFRKAP